MHQGFRCLHAEDDGIDDDQTDDELLYRGVFDEALDRIFHVFPLPDKRSSKPAVDVDAGILSINSVTI
jgi:hypothetical protein